MSEKTEPKRYINWQDLAEQLGADTENEIDDYFITARFEGPDPDESELPPRQPSITITETTMSFKSDTTGPGDAVPDGTPDEAGDAAAASESAVNPDAELDIDWGQPSSESVDSSVSDIDVTESVTADASSPHESAPDEQPVAETGAHWDDLASSLGVAPVREVEKRPAAKSKSRDQESRKSKRSHRESARSRDTEEPTAASSAFGAGLIDFDDIEDDREEVTQKGILDEMFVPSDDPAAYEDDEDTVISGTEDIEDEPEEFAGGVIVEDDQEYIEFEVEELEPAGGRPRRRPAAREESASRPPRSRRPRRDDDAEERPARSRKRRDKEESPGGRSRRDEQDEERPRRRRRRRKSSADAGSETAESRRPPRDDDSSDDIQADLDDRKVGKPKKLPTWSETIDVIVEANLASRKKPSRRRRGGRSRRGKDN